MRIVVVGAGSGTGREVARQGVARGHEVVAVARRGCDVPGVTDEPRDRAGEQLFRRVRIH